MRNITLARVDNRLIHGEAVAARTPSLSVSRIVIIDDTVAAGKFNKQVLMTLAPQETKAAVLSVEGATKALQKPDPGNERAIVLIRTPIVFEQLLDGDVGIKEVRLGGTGIRRDRKLFINNVSTNPDEVDSIRRMKNGKGVNVYCQSIPEQKVVDMPNLL